MGTLTKCNKKKRKEILVFEEFLPLFNSPQNSFITLLLFGEKFPQFSNICLQQMLNLA
jgi:hypothetical protein